MDWLLRRLADRMGVAPPGAGESFDPRIRPDHPLSQGMTVLIVGLAAAWIIWLYRREGSASLPYKMFLASLRIALVILALFMLSEAVLSVDRTGLPYFVVMVDDSASQRVVDQYADPKAKEAAADLARASGQADATRLALAKGFLYKDDGKFLRDLQKQHRVRLYLVSSSAVPFASIDQPEQIAPALEKLKNVEPSGDQSRLGTGVRQVLGELRGMPPTAIVLLTDGQTTEGETLAKAAEFAAKKGVPLYPIGLGDPEPPRDIELSELMVDDVVFVDDLVRFQPRLASRGYAGQELTVHLRRKVPSAGNPDAVQDLETVKIVAPPDGQPTRVDISHRPREVGQVTYIVEVDAKPRELRAENNRLEKLVNVREEKLKVLYVDSEPRYEFRYLKTFLDREKTISLNVVLQASDPQFSNQDRAALPTFPASKDDLFEYDVVIIGDADPGFLSATEMNHLVEFVTEKGGGVLFVAGENFNPLGYRGTPLEMLLPVDLAEARNPTAVAGSIAGFRPSLTVEGRANPIFRFGDDEVQNARIWAGLPQLFWYFEAPRKKPAALVLAEHPTQAGSDGPLPLIAYQFVGSGKSMFHAVDDTWRWRFRVGDRYFGRFWTQTIRFLARSKLLGQKQAEVQTDRKRYQRNQPIEVRVRFPNPALVPANNEVTVRVSRKGQAGRKLSLKPAAGSRNVFEGVLPQAAEGEYEVRLLPPPTLEGIPTATFGVDPPAGESEQTQMNEPELIRAATASGGKFYTPRDLTGLGASLPLPQKVPLDTDPPIPLWNTWPVLALFLTLLVSEWILRKRGQMV
ncbi:VWA domain-containing protein [Tundrisphaera sp. TA3]|uniref:VWA domain-containing protein n=1 Tax=Tundrisphaera sp. TA3 TaxID=3435775 RepID=UPI003EB86CB0